jgi:hypothetical protein
MLLVDPLQSPASIEQAGSTVEAVVRTATR